MGVLLVVLEDGVHNLGPFVGEVDQYADFAPWEALVQLEQIVGQVAEHQVGVVVIAGAGFGQHAHIAWCVFAALLVHQLLVVAVVVSGLVGAAHQLRHGVASPCVVIHQQLEQAVVERDHGFQTAEVGGQVGQAQLLLEFFVDAVAKQAWVGVAEAVDRLLGVADDEVEVVAAVRQALVQQRHEVVVLLVARVLELVDHEMVDPRAHAFIDKRHGVVSGHEVVDEVVGVGNEHHVVVLAVLLQFQVYLSDESEQSHVGDQLVEELPAAEGVHQVVDHGHGLVEQCGRQR